MPYKDKTKRNEYSRKCMKRLRDSRKQENIKNKNNSTEDALVIPIVEIPILPSPSKPDRFTSYNNNFREKLKLIEEQNKMRLRQLEDGSIQWKITVSDGVDYIDTTPYMPLSYR